MLLRFKIKKRFGVILLIITIIIFNALPLLLPINFTSNNEQLIIKPSGETYYTDVLWLDNPTFEDPIEPIWFPDIEGDESDVDTSTSLNQANLQILGEEYTFEVIADPPDGNWTAVNNPSFPRFPDNHFTDSVGLNVYHYWDEDEDQTHNTPSVHWKRNFTMPVNMADYIITSASIQSTFNATVTVGPHSGGGIDCPGDTLPQSSTFDYARFYVLVSDPNNTYEYEIAYNQTVDLGQDSPEISNYSDTRMVNIPEDVLIAFLTSIFKENNFNFTITLGIDIYCEDNEPGVDEDRWDSLIIRSLDFKFTYRKKIDQFTSVSWNQEGAAISGSNKLITGATLLFKYKIDQDWTSSSPNSEIRVLINNNLHSETIKLSKVTNTFQEAKTGGYDVTFLILKDVNISLSIQIYLADEFGLEKVITVSITDVYLYISYIVTFPDIFSEPWIFAGLFIIAIIGASLLAAYLIAYQTYLKYPVPVRKVRKYRKTLTKEKDPGVHIIKRKSSFKKIFRNELDKTSKFLKGAPLDGKIIREKLIGNQQTGSNSEK